MNASESGLRTALVYFFVLTTCGLAIWLTLSLGSGLRTDAGRGSVVSPAAVRLDYQGGIQTIARMLTANLRQPLGVLLLQLILIIVAARLLGSLSLKIGQPRVIGEMVAGILLGPSFLGYFSPAALDFLFPPSSIEHLRLFSQVGIILYMFLVGIELDLQSIRKMAHTAVWVSHASIVVPFLLGTVLSFFIYRSTAPVGVPFSVFALFIGVSMSITAFPVLARIIEERGLSRSPLGIMAIACAAVDDVTAWCILAFVLAIATSGDLGGFGHGSHWSSRIIRAFLAGIVMPPGRLREFCRDRLETTVAGLLLPLFFAFTGLRTQITLLGNSSLWLICAFVIGIAIVGKLGASMLAARLSRFEWREAFALGALMNTRGLMELVVLNIGLDLGILSAPLFAIMVLMALVTTFMTAPLVSLARIEQDTAD